MHGLGAAFLTPLTGTSAIGNSAACEREMMVADVTSSLLWLGGGYFAWVVEVKLEHHVHYGAPVCEEVVYGHRRVDVRIRLAVDGQRVQVLGGFAEKNLVVASSGKGRF